MQLNKTKYCLFFLFCLGVNLLKAQVEIQWNNMVGCSVSEGSLTKTASGNNYNAGAISENVLPSGQDGWARFTISQLGQKMAFGFSQIDNGTSLNSIEYAFETGANNRLKIYTNGTLIGTFGSIKVGDILKIERKGTTINFYNNKTLLKSMELKYNDNAFKVDVALGTQGVIVSNALASFIKPLTINPIVKDINSLTGELGSITLNISGGVPPYRIEWKSQYGDNKGADQSVFSDLEIGTYYVSILDAANAYISRDFTIYNKIDWKDSAGVVVSDSSLIKTTGVDSWEDAGAFSLQDLTAEESGILIHRITSLKSIYAIGLHNTALPKSGYGYTTMEYSFMIRNKTLLIYKKNKLQVKFATDLVIGDELKIEKTKDGVYFYYNGINLYKDAIAAPYGVCAQVSLNKANTELKQIKTTFVRPVRIFYTQTDVNCIRDRKGKITINPIGGVQPYEYEFDGKISKENVFSDLAAGEYILKVTDRTKRTASSVVSILNCPMWVDGDGAAFSVNSNGDIVKTMEGNTWEGKTLETNEAFTFTPKPEWISFNVPDTGSVFMIGYSSIDLDVTAQPSNYRLLVQDGIATVVETDNDGFYNKRQLKRVSKDMGFKIQLTQEGIEYYIRNNAQSPYQLEYVSKLFTSSKLKLETNIFKQGSRINAVRISNYGNTSWPTLD